MMRIPSENVSRLYMAKQTKRRKYTRQKGKRVRGGQMVWTNNPMFEQKIKQTDEVIPTVITNQDEIKQTDEVIPPVITNPDEIKMNPDPIVIQVIEADKQVVGQKSVKIPIQKPVKKTIPIQKHTNNSSDWFSPMTRIPDYTPETVGVIKVKPGNNMPKEGTSEFAPYKLRPGKGGKTRRKRRRRRTKK